MVFRALRRICLVCACAIGVNTGPFVPAVLAQTAEAHRADVIVIHTSSDLSPVANQGDGRPASVLITDDGDASVGISVSRASDLVGTRSTVVREQFGGDVATSSFSDRPIIVIGAEPRLAAAPLVDLRVTSRFGVRRHPINGVRRQHAGVDYGAAYGTPIMATGDATVTHAGSAGGYGLMVKLDHGSGLETRYAHMSRIAVSAGDRVTSGQVIGYVGSTGRSTGSHLHYETRVNGRAVDPQDR